MAYSGTPSFGKAGQSNEADHIDPDKPIFNVAPLNSMPYIPPSTERSGARESGEQRKMEPAMVLLPSLATREERDRILETSKGVVLTGVAATGQLGPIIGKVDIGEADVSYLFRVSLPGVSRDENFSCSIEADGEVKIKGVTTTGEKTVCKNSMVFQMLTQNLAPAGHFSISFHLPGPVDFQQFTGSFETDGILEGIVKKKM